MTGINSSLSLDNLIPFSRLKFPKAAAKIKQRLGARVPTLEVAERTASILNCSLDDLYLVEGSFYPYAYYKDLVFESLMTLEPEVLHFTQVEKRIAQVHKGVRESLESGDYELLFTLWIDKRLTFLAFRLLYDQIPDNKKYSIFKRVYTLNEYGFNTLEPEMMREIISYQTEEDKRLAYESLESKVVNGRVTVYRGEATKSTPYTKAYSWTTDISTAFFFATRYSGKGKVYKTEVAIEDIIDFIDSRNEDEVWISPESVGEVSVLNASNVTERRTMLVEAGVEKRFLAYSRRIKPDLFFRPTGIHGVNHCRRVLYHVLNLSHEFNLTLSEERILATAACYHDIGRMTDYEDDAHGYASVKKMRKLGLGRMDTTQETLILWYIIQNHCIEDRKAFANVEGRGIEDEELAIRLLKIFKDADGLDRVRLNDLDTNYLRHEESKLFVSLALSLYNEKSD